MSERDEQIAFFDVLKANERTFPFLKWIHASMNGVHSANAKTALDRKRQGQKPGISDIFVPIPKGRYHGAYFEMKFGKNKLTSEQIEFGNFVMDKGYYFKTCWSADALIAALEEYLGIRLVKK
jgi:hypothetical protein